MFLSKNKPSLLRNLFISCLGFGLGMGIVFPFYAQFFVEWKPGMYSWFVLGCLIAGGTIGLVNYTLVRTLLLNKLKRLSNVTQSIEKKDLTQTCSLVSFDMVGDMAKGFNSMAGQLRSIVADISTRAEQLQDSVDSISTISAASDKAQQEQRSQIEQVASAMNEMAATVQEVARHTAEAASATQSANDKGGHAKVVVVEAMSAVNVLAEMMQKAVQTITQLKTESETITQVVSVINGIAEQTNLLALNAAIEAARAGEQGRGFAVVADEVRSLATRTQRSTQEITVMIDSLQAGTQSAVEVMQQGSAQATKGVDLTEAAAESLADISGALDIINTMNIQIAHAAREQKEVAESINLSFSTINKISEENSQHAAEVNSSSHQMAGVARQLRDLIADFKT